MSEQQINTLICAVLETQAYYDVYWQIPNKLAAAYNMLLDKLNYQTVQLEIPMTLHPDIQELLEDQTKVAKETTETLFLGPPSDPKNHYKKSILRLCNLMLNESASQDVADLNKQVFTNLYYFLKCEGLRSVTIESTLQPDPYPLWFSEGLLKVLESYQTGNLSIFEIDYLAELQIRFIHTTLKDSKNKQKNTNRNEQVVAQNNATRYTDTQQSQSQQQFYGSQQKQRTKSNLVSNWFHFKTYNNLRPRDIPAQIKRHKAVSCSQVDLQTPYSPPKQSPYNLKVFIKPRWFEHIHQK